MNNLLTQMEPTRVTMGDREIQLFFSMGAAAQMEKELDMPYHKILEELFQRHEEDQPEPAPMTWERQAVVIACLARAGGEDISAEDVMGLHMREFSALAQGAVKEILFKTPQGSKKK